MSQITAEEPCRLRFVRNVQHVFQLLMNEGLVCFVDNRPVGLKESACLKVAIPHIRGKRHHGRK